MFGYLAREFKRDLVDSLDKPATRRKTFERIFQFMVTVFFLEGHDVVSSGCVKTFIEIMENVLPELLDDGH